MVFSSASLPRPSLVLILLIAFYFEVITHQASAYFPKRLDFRLTSFSNTENRTAQGQCCDGNKTASLCPDGCDTYFRVCLHPPCLHKNRSNHSQVISKSSTFRQQNFQESDANLVTFFNPELWKGIRFTIDIYDDDTLPENYFNGNISSSELLMTYKGNLSSDPGEKWTVVCYSNHNISFQLFYRITCPKYFYQKRCSQYCTPDHFHICLANGTKTCRKGYTGPNCNTAICPNECSKHGQCQSPNNCSCYEGWKGPDCSQCVPVPPCSHGTCTKSPGTCNCRSGWTGNYCNIHTNYCSLGNPCKNNGVCRNHQKTNYTCECTPNYDGPNCERYVCPACNLDHAECIPNIGCRCHDGWIGALCNISTGSPINCTHDNPCQYNGTCETLRNGTSRCFCKDGFIGRYCENDTRCYENCNKTNGFCDGTRCSCHPGWQGPNCNQCVKSSTCSIHGFCKNPLDCVCQKGWTGPTCNERTQCSRCNKSRGSCDKDNICRCYSGWQGPNCNQCTRNLSCVNGYCMKPFECICWSGWSGITCNISNCSQSNNKSCEEPSTLSRSRDVQAVYISCAIGVLVFAMLLAALYFLWRHFRRRAEFCVTTPEVFVNNNRSKQSYHHDDKIICSMNNNFRGVRDLAPGTDIIRNKMFISQDLPLHSFSNGKNPSKSLNRSDSGFVEEGILPNAVKY